jgi:hypothetical protein
VKAKAYVKVGPHRRAFPKRKFRDGGVSTDSDRPDLDILAKQGLSPEKAPGLPPRIGNEWDMLMRSDVHAGSNKPTPMSRFEQDPQRLDVGKGSVLKEMLDQSADRVQNLHDYSRAGAAIRASHDRPAKRFAYGGASSSSDDAGPFDSWEEERQREQYGSSPASNVMRGVRMAEAAAPPASTLPSSDVSSGLPPAITADDAGPMAAPAPAPTPPTPSVPSVTAPLPATGPPGATLTGTKSTPGQGDPNFQKNSPQATGMDWRKIAAAGLKGATTGTGALAAIGGAALGSYLKSRNQKKKDASIADYITDYNVDSEDYAKGGEVGPSSSDQRSRPARPMRRPAGPPAYVPPPGLAPTFPGGVGQITPPGGSPPMGGPPPGGPPLGGVPGAPPPSGPPPSGGPSQQEIASSIRGFAPGWNSGAPSGSPNPQIMAAMQAAQQGARMPPGGPPPGGPLPGGSSMGPLPGGPPPGPPPGAIPPGVPSGPPSGGPPPQSNWTPDQMQAVGNPNSPWAAAKFPGNPNNPSWGTPEAQAALRSAPGTPPAANGPGGPQYAPASSSMGPVQGGPQAGMPPGGPPPGVGGGLNRPVTPDEIQQFLARKQAMGMAKGGTVEFEGPRTKVRPDRQWGNIGKPAEDLPPIPEKKAKGGVIKRRPAGKKKLVKGDKLPVPMVTDEDMGTAPHLMQAGPSSVPAPMGPPAPAPAGPPMGMAEGGVAKLRRGYPNTKGTAKVKKMAKGGSVRGCGAARKGTGFSGIY